MTLRARLIGAAAGGKSAWVDDSGGLLIREGTGLALRILHPPAIWGKSLAYAAANMIAGQGAGKSSTCIIAALYPLLTPGEFPELTVDNVIIIWGDNLTTMLVFFEQEACRRAVAGAPPIRRIIFVLNDAREHHAGVEQGSDARSAQNRVAVIRHFCRDVQADVGWPVGGAVTLLINSQSRTSVSPFLRINVSATWYYGYSMDPVDTREMLADLCGEDKLLRLKVRRVLREITTRRMLGDITANSLSVCKIRSQDICLVDLGRLFRLLDARGMTDEVSLAEMGLIHIVDDDPRLAREDVLRALALRIGARTDWTKDKQRIRAELHFLSQDAQEEKRIREQATKKGMAGCYTTFQAVYSLVRSERDASEVIDEVDEEHERRLAVFAWLVDGRARFSVRGDRDSGTSPAKLLRTLRRAGTAAELGPAYKDLWRDPRALTEWMRKSDVEIQAETGVVVSHDKYKGLSTWYLYRPETCSVTHSPPELASADPAMTSPRSQRT